MKILKDIFVTYEIAQKLKEIGFDERCIAFYTEDKEIYSCIQREETKGQYISGKLVGNMYRDVTLNAPTWEQVFKWFVEKDFSYSLGIGKNRVLIVVLHLDEVLFSESVMGDNHTQKARELLIDEMIKVYTKNVPQ